MKKKGISLIVLVITIVVIIILAAAVIISINNNNPIKNAKEARNKSDAITLKEKVEMELTSYRLNSSISNKDLTISEMVDKLKENNILNDDMTFKQSSKYSFTYGGNIRNENGEIVESVDFSNYQTNKSTLEVLPSSGATAAVGSFTVNCVNGIVRYYSDSETTVFKIIANEAPAGYKFAYWIDKFDNVLSYNQLEYGRTVTDNTFIPIYVKSDVLVDKKVCVSVHACPRTVEDRLCFQTYQTSDLDESLYEITVGVLATNNLEWANEEYMIATKETDSSGVYKFFNRGGKYGKASSTYAWNKGNAGTDTWYARGYAIVTNKTTGESQVYYSKDIVSAHK